MSDDLRPPPKSKRPPPDPLRGAAFPGVLIVHQRHGTNYYGCRTGDDLLRHALDVLKARYEAGFYNPSTVVPEKPEVPPGFQFILDDRSDGTAGIRKAWADRVEEYTSKLQARKFEVARFMRVRTTVLQEPSMAWAVLDNFPGDSRDDRVEYVEEFGYDIGGLGEDGPYQPTADEETAHGWQRA